MPQINPVGPAFAAAPLVEERHAPLRRIEEPAHCRVDRAAWAAVQDHTGFAERGAAFLVVDLVRPVGPGDFNGIDPNDIPAAQTLPRSISPAAPEVPLAV